MPVPLVEQLGTPGRHPVVFLGGWAMTVENYRDRLDALAEHFTVYAITLPGFGPNTALPLHESTLTGHAHAIHRAIEQLHLTRPYTLLGHSTGAGIAALLADRHPHHVRELILITPVGHPDPVIRGTVRTLRSLPALETAHGSRERRSIRADLDLSWNKNLLANLRLAISAKRANLTSTLTGLTDVLPVHLILAPDDTVTPPGSLLTIPGAHIHTVTGGHAWFATRPHECHELLLGILQPQPPAATAPAPEAHPALQWIRRTLTALTTAFTR